LFATILTIVVAGISQALTWTNTGLTSGANTLLPANLKPPVIDGDPRDWPALEKLHSQISLDDKQISDWYTEYYPDSSHRITRSVTTNISRNIYVFRAGNNSFLYYRGEFIWFDATGDTRTGVNTPQADLVEVRVTGDENYLYILVRVASLIAVGSGDPRNPSLLLSIPIDVDMNYLNGNTTTVDPNTNVSPYAPWDYQIVIDLTNPNVKPNTKICGDGENGTALDILDPSYSDVSSSTSCFVANPAVNAVEIAISWRDIGVLNSWNVSNVRMYVISFLGNGFGKPVTDLAGSQAIDVLSANDTDTEVSDNIVDYWVDIGFTTACEPTYFYHHVLDDKGFIQGYSDLSTDYRTDYIPNEAFDTDLISTILWFDNENDALYMLIHVKGLVKPAGNISPAIAIVIDTSPENFSDGVDSWIHVPPGYAQANPYTDTELGVPPDFPVTARSANWTHIIWFFSRLSGDLEDYWIVVYNGSVTYESNITVRVSEHFIEASVPLSSIDSRLGYKPFRYTVMSFAYVLRSFTTPPPVTLPDSILDLWGSNIYDVTTPYPTYSPVGVELVYGKPYAVEAEVYDADGDVVNDLETGNGDHWVDAFTTFKYATRIVNAALHYRSFDKDEYIEIGEPAWINCTLEYFNGTAWAPLPSKTVYFYLVNTATGNRIFLGTNSTDGNGTAYLDLNDIASRVPSGSYRVLAVYTPAGIDEYYYAESSNTSLGTYTILRRPFTTVLPEPSYTPLLLVLAVLAATLLKYYSRNLH